MKNWYLYCKKGDFEAISEEFGISPILARLLVNRGISTSEEIRSFLFDGIEQLYDPYLMKDMDKAVSITMEKINAGEKIRVIGDYDMDGVCASTVLKKFFEYMDADIDVRLPHRIFDGYGMNPQMAEATAEDGVALIITCDNGISSYDAVCRANELGIKVVITDHHEPPADIPPAYAVVDAKQHDCGYPYKEICGAAVCYKFAQAVISYIKDQGFEFKAGRSLNGLNDLLVNDLIQYAGMATVADIVPLKNENRIFAKEGIRVLNRTENPGLKALIREKGIEEGKWIGAYHIGFIIGPCVNSAGRLEKAKIAFDLFDTDDEAEAALIARELSELNEKRKELTIDQSDRAEEIIRESGCLSDDSHRIFVIYLPNAHESVAGIIAGKLKEKYLRPVLIITDSEEGLKGSGRSTDDYNLIEALARHADMFTKYGGHAKAAGFTLRCTPEELSEALNSDIQAENAGKVSKTWIDMQLPFSYVTESLAEEINRLEPFGLENDRPLFAERNVRLCNIKTFGKNSNVLKARLENDSGDSVEGIYFAHPGLVSAEEIRSYAEEKGNDALFTIIYRVNINEFRNQRYPQAVIEDINPSQE